MLSNLGSATWLCLRKSLNSDMLSVRSMSKGKTMIISSWTLVRIFHVLPLVPFLFYSHCSDQHSEEGAPANRKARWPAVARDDRPNLISDQHHNPTQLVLLDLQLRSHSFALSSSSSPSSD